MTAVCVKCHIELRPLKNGAWFESMADFGSYEIRAGDIWHCPGCGLEVGIGFASTAVASHFDPDYGERRKGFVEPGDTVVQHWQHLKAKEQAETLPAADTIVHAKIDNISPAIFTTISGRPRR